MPAQPKTNNIQVYSLYVLIFISYVNDRKKNI